MPTNLAYPYHLDVRGRTATAGDEDHIRQLIEQLLFTSPGERVNHPDFGSGLMSMVFAPNSPELAATLQFTVRAALLNWMGDLIEVQSLSVEAADSKLQVSLSYVIRRTGAAVTEVFSQGGAA